MKWIKCQDDFDLISCADDGLGIYQKLKTSSKILFKGHTNSVTALDGLWNKSTFTAVTTSADSTIKLWRMERDHQIVDTLEAFQTIDLKTGICFAVKILKLPDAGLLLAFSTDDDKIHFYGENSEKVFEKIEELKGHEDWVRGLDFIVDDNGDVLLASSSQDSFIRLWRISERKSNEVEISGELIQIEERTFTLGNKKFGLYLDSVLQGHENWVYSVHWNRNPETHTLQLLSSSMDKSMIIYCYDKELKVWIEKVRVGEVGGNTLGFYEGKFHHQGKSIIGVGFQGSLHLWYQSEENERIWTPGIIQSGHFKEVRDISWEPNGEFLLSTSVDQTTRIHGCWKESNTYHEIARPQVHGYDMQCLAVLSRYKFASAAEEKIIRVFQAPGNFIENFRSLITQDNSDSEGDEILISNQKGASVPSLGLSNKIVYEEDFTNGGELEQKRFRDEYPENYFVPMEMKTPPTEEYLMQNTLWPEMQKLYAHGYEIYSLAATNDGTILASACKSTSLEHAEIILWNTSTWNIHQRLRSHKLTVTQMKFSSDGKRLLAVSRDRRWSLFERSGLDSVNFELISTTDKTNGIHERIIWSCDWSHDDLYFATSSRDGKVVIWHKNQVLVEESSLKQYSSVAIIKQSSESITGVAFAPILFKEKYLLAVGLESGVIQIYTFNRESCELISSINQSEAHHLCVNKLQFRPSNTEFHLASCGSDNILRIFEIK